MKKIVGASAVANVFCAVAQSRESVRYKPRGNAHATSRKQNRASRARAKLPPDCAHGARASPGKSKNFTFDKSEIFTLHKATPSSTACLAFHPREKRQ